ncbi:hypothetical protein B5M47_02260 [candidate division CPR3 bacterium 4484_211]|uniref:ABC transporter substrate-binding protein n=1 Tax=candidate division CPR3 bacterium 4484_211 TaxID=1968527 RepID=A0A1W9NYD1_UNCC3|nr:MAG: hypothetical protein B5M47_02260 [candidate division CPR3 bacterium 4484_211]
MKRPLVIAALVLLILAVFFILVMNKIICLPSWLPLLGGQCENDTTPKEITLTYWSLWENAANIQPLIDKYQSLHPGVHIDFQQREPVNYFETVRARLATELTPDIIRVHNTWVPYLRKYLSAVPNEIMSPEVYEQTFYPVTKDTLYADGKYYAIPLEIDGLAMMYNKTLLSEAGITQLPRTWDEFKEVSAKLTKKDAAENITQAGTTLGYARGIEHFSDILGLLLAQRQIDFEDKNHRVSFHKSLSALGENLGVEVLNFYKIFSTSRKSWNDSWDCALDAFAEGKLAFFFAPSFRVLDIFGKNPNLPLGIAPVPQLAIDDPETPTVNWGTFWVETVPKHSPYQKEAWEFLSFLSQKENLAEMFRLAQNTPGRPFGEPYPRRDMAEELANNQYLSAYIIQAPTYTSWNMADATHDELLNDRIVKILQEMINKVNRGAKIQDYLNEAAAKTQQILDSL